MILGTGIDQIETKRMAKKLEADLGLKQVLFSIAEITYCEQKAFPAQHFAARFTAKEAFLKAIGTGWREGIKFNEIEIVHDELGKPHIHLHGRALEIASNKQVGKIHVSLSHLKETASAIVIIELK